MPGGQELEAAVLKDAERIRRRAHPFLEAIEGGNQPYLDLLGRYVKKYIELHGI